MLDSVPSASTTRQQRPRFGLLAAEDNSFGSRIVASRASQAGEAASFKAKQLIKNLVMKLLLEAVEEATTKFGGSCSGSGCLRWQI